MSFSSAPRPPSNRPTTEAGSPNGSGQELSEAGSSRGGGSAKDKARKSQRQPLSCTECTRRKTRCDKVIPCSNCIKRDKRDECHLEITTKEAPVSRTSSKYALSQIDLLRAETSETTANLSSRLGALEQLFVQHFPSPNALLLPSASPTTDLYPLSSSHPSSEHQKLFQIQNQSIHPSSSHQSSQNLQVSQTQGQPSHSPQPPYPPPSHSPFLQTEAEHLSVHQQLAVPLSSSSDSTETSQDVEAEAAATLEFLSMGRSRARTTGALLAGPHTHYGSGPMVGRRGESGERNGASQEANDEDSDPDAEGEDEDIEDVQDGSRDWENNRQPTSRTFPEPSSNPLPTPSSVSSRSNTFRPSANQPHLPDPRYTRHAAPLIPPIIAPNPSSAKGSSSVMDHLPSERVGRLLIDYELEHVSWMHAAVHTPSFREECELFWTEGYTGEVEVNRAWLALFWAVLMSGLYHLPSSEAERLFPNENIHKVLSCYFDACLASLNEANWMSNHSLYSIQTIAVIISPANHLGKSDLYFVLLSAAIRIAQTLNINHLGRDPPDFGKVQDGRALVTREVCKRIWWQFVIQDFFHLPFNRSCSISTQHFNTPLPLFVGEEALLDPSTLVVDKELPSLATHTVFLSRLALLVNKLFESVPASGCVAYSTVLQLDSEARSILEDVPSWMQLDKDGNPRPIPDGSPPWLEWQRQCFFISCAHKVIVLHRPYLGRAFRDPAYQYSRERCVTLAKSILRRFRDCSLESFRKTWTVLAHSVAASIILMLESCHPPLSTNCDSKTQPPPPPSPIDPEPVSLVLDTIEILRGLATCSTIAAKGLDVLLDLTSKKRDAAGSGGKRRRRNSEGSDDGEGGEMRQAVKMLKTGGGQDHRRQQSSPPSPPATAPSHPQYPHPYRMPHPTPEPLPAPPLNDSHAFPADVYRPYPLAYPPPSAAFASHGLSSGPLQDPAGGPSWGWNSFEVGEGGGLVGMGFGGGVVGDVAGGEGSFDVGGFDLLLEMNPDHQFM